mgnify:FL=1
MSILLETLYNLFMKKLVFILLITVTSFGQKRLQKNFSKSAAVEFLLNDQSLIYGAKQFSLLEIVNEAKKFGYYIYKEDDQFVFDVYPDGVWPMKLFILEKDINDYNYEFFPSYSIGKITKYFYLHKVKDETEGGGNSNKIFSSEPSTSSWIQMVETKISLTEYSNVSRRSIDNYFFNLEKYYRTNYIDKYKPSETTQLIMEDFPKFSNTKFSTLTSSKLTFEDNGLVSNHFISFGSDYENLNFTDGTTRKAGVFAINTTSGLLKDVLYGMKLAGDLDNVLYENKLEQKFIINGKDVREISTYDLTSMVSIFLDDCAKFNISVPNINTLKATFEPLEGNTIALAYSMNLDDKIVIKVDPSKWQEASVQKKWYILYHELGHDVLNLEHGEGGKMMFNFSEKDYTWEEFFEDKEYMFKAFKKNN